MMTFLLLLAAGATRMFDVPRELVRPEEAVRRVKACGFEKVTVKGDATLQEDVILVSGVSSASTEKLRCVAKASLDTVYYVEFPGQLNDAYWRIYQRVSDDAGRREARAWLERRGLLARLPTYKKGVEDDLVFARRLEELCGPNAKGVFIRDHGIISMKLGTPEKPSFDDDTFVCLSYAAGASGLPVYFIGNAYLPDDKKPSRQ